MKLPAIIMLFSLLAGCEGNQYRQISPRLPNLLVTLADPAWDGNTIPPSQVCAEQGGQASTPALRISGIPEGTNAIIVEFNNQDLKSRRRNGGHGKIGYWIEPTPKAFLIAVEAETSNVEAPAFVEADSRGDVVGYLPPCSGGRGHRYFAVVKAVFKPLDDDKAGKLLAIGRIELGRY